MTHEELLQACVEENIEFETDARSQPVEDIRAALMTQKLTADQSIEGGEDADLDEIREVVCEMDDREALQACQEEGIAVPDGCSLAQLQELLLRAYTAE